MHRHARPILSSLPETDSLIFIFRAVPSSGETFDCIWDQMGHGIFRIQPDRGLDGGRKTINESEGGVDTEKSSVNQLDGLCIIRVVC